MYFCSFIDACIFSICGHSITPYYAHKVYNATKTAITVLCEGLRHELSLVNSKIKVSVSNDYWKLFANDVTFVDFNNTTLDNTYIKRVLENRFRVSAPVAWIRTFSIPLSSDPLLKSWVQDRLWNQKTLQML